MCCPPALTWVKKLKNSLVTIKENIPMKKAGNLLGTILDLGEELLKAGAEVWRVEEILGEVFEAYCFKKQIFG